MKSHLSFDGWLFAFPGGRKRTRPGWPMLDDPAAGSTQVFGRTDSARRTTSLFRSQKPVRSKSRAASNSARHSLTLATLLPNARRGTPATRAVTTT